MHEMIAPVSAEFPLRAASLLAQHLQHGLVQLLIGTEDIEAAYRRMPCSQPHYTIFAILDPTTNEVVFFALQGFNIGLKSAVVQFNRLSALMAASVSRFLGLVLANYFDDFCVIERAFSKGGRALLREFARLLRIPFASSFMGDGKSAAPNAIGSFLGVLHDFSQYSAAGLVTIVASLTNRSLQLCL
jgi:hypothetical protein